jgi:hypothetical protein
MPPFISSGYKTKNSQSIVDGSSADSVTKGPCVSVAVQTPIFPRIAGVRSIAETLTKLLSAFSTDHFLITSDIVQNGFSA